MAGALGWALFFFAVWVLGQLYGALRRNTSEGARRLRLVLKGVGVLFLTIIVFNMGGPVAVIITAAVIGVVWWVVRGFRK